jgi:citronellol/citronellal dehydrogenase
LADHDLFELRDKAVLITGATSLISVWTARMLLDVGARVAMTDRFDDVHIREAFADLAAEGGDPALDLSDQVTLIGQVDVRNRLDSDLPADKAGAMVSVREMVRRAIGELGHVDVLMNIAGGQEPVPAAMLSTEIFRKTVDRILIGTWNVIHEVFEQSMRDRGGRILTITADADQGYPGMPAMGAARNGLSSLHRALSVEWAPLGITCCVIAPGATDTPGLKRYPMADQVRAMGIEAANLGRLFHPREIAWLFLVMASPLAVAVNGHTLVANGGDSNLSPVYQRMRELFATST